MGKSYVVVVGWKPGIYKNWIECSGQIKNVPRAVHQSFDTYEEALAVFHGALERGEVEAVQPNPGAASASATRIKNEMDGNMYQPVTPSRMHRVGDARTVRQLRQTPWDDVSLLHSPRQMLSPEPPTGVTQYVDLPDDPWLQPERGLSPRVTVEDTTSYTSSSSCVNDVSHLLMRPRHTHIRRGEASPTSSVMSIEKTISPRDLRRQATAPASFEAGARYPTLEEICKGQDLDPRVMIPPSRIFDPANVKPRPGAVSARRKNDQMDAESTNPRYSTTHLVHDRLPAVDYPEYDEQSISSLPRHQVANKGKSRAPADAATEALCASGYVSCNNRHSFSQYPYHFQEVYSLDRPEQRSVVVVHCPPGNSCCHRDCESASARTAVMNERIQSRYADVGVSPIISSVSSARTKSDVRDPGARVSDASSGQGFHSVFGFSSPQVSRSSYAVESDVRSPFARGTRVPSGLSE
ncbi:hypothetical protein F4604DRAFT_1709544 [Suillus subluteus]|nr:hypothetical protein F4604DRAFT_1709544 [Suillus subluteus]